jgi:hypothetical protein
MGSGDRAQNATFTLLQFEEWGLPHRPLAGFEVATTCRFWGYDGGVKRAWSTATMAAEVNVADLPTKDFLLSILEMLKKQCIYLHRQHGWMISVAEALRTDPALQAALEEQPFFHQAPREDVRITEQMVRDIDALIARLQSGVP